MLGRLVQTVANFTDASQDSSEVQQVVKLENLSIYLETLGLIAPFENPSVQSRIRDVQQRIQSTWAEALRQAAIATDSYPQDDSDSTSINQPAAARATTMMSQEQAQIIVQTMRDECFLEEVHNLLDTSDAGVHRKDDTFLLLRPNYFDVVAIRNALIRHDRDGRTIIGQFKNGTVAYWDNLCNYYTGKQHSSTTTATTTDTPLPLELTKNANVTEALHLLHISVRFTIPSLQQHSSYLVKRKQILERKRFDMKRKQTELPNRHPQEFVYLSVDFVGLLSSTDEVTTSSIDEQIHGYAKRELARQLKEVMSRVLQAPALPRVMDYHFQIVQFLQQTSDVTISSPLSALKCALAKSLFQNNESNASMIKEEVDELHNDVSELVCFLTQRLDEMNKGSKDIIPPSSQLPVEDLKQALHMLSDIANALNTGKIPLLIKVCESKACRKRLAQRLRYALDEMGALQSAVTAVDQELQNVQSQQSDTFRTLPLLLKRVDLLRENIAKQTANMLKMDSIKIIV